MEVVCILLVSSIVALVCPGDRYRHLHWCMVINVGHIHTHPLGFTCIYGVVVAEWDMWHCNILPFSRHHAYTCCVKIELNHVNNKHHLSKLNCKSPVVRMMGRWNLLWEYGVLTTSPSYLVRFLCQCVWEDLDWWRFKHIASSMRRRDVRGRIALTLRQQVGGKTTLVTWGGVNEGCGGEWGGVHRSDGVEATRERPWTEQMDNQDGWILPPSFDKCSLVC